MISKLLSFWVSIPLAIVLGLAPGFWLCAKWEGGAFDTWSYTVPIPFWRPVLRLPASRAERDAAQLQAALANNAVLQRAIVGQNAAIEANAVRGAAALKSAESAIRQSRVDATAAAPKLRLISAPIVGDTTCDRVKAFDKTFLETLK